MASLHSVALSSSLDLPKSSQIFGSSLNLAEKELTHLRVSPNCSNRSTPSLRTQASRMPPALSKKADNTKDQMNEKASNQSDPFSEMKQRFLSFKKDKYLANIEHYEKLANSQAPKFTVIACGDSRVCPSAILGFEPGQAFIVRNVANLVPPFESGPSETKAALEFSVNALQVENILVIGHSRCGGIHALMSMEDEDNSRSFIRDWVLVGKNARLRTKSVASNLNFEQQCRHCEKESVNHSLMNLLSYPWIKERVANGTLSLHGGYYDFVHCTFEKWTLDYEHGYSVKDREFWL